MAVIELMSKVNSNTFNSTRGSTFRRNYCLKKSNKPQFSIIFFPVGFSFLQLKSTICCNTKCSRVHYGLYMYIGYLMGLSLKLTEERSL